MTDAVQEYLLMLLIGAFFGAMAGVALSASNWRSDTVERGLALYCPDNGHWAWKGECEK